VPKAIATSASIPSGRSRNPSEHELGRDIDVESKLNFLSGLIGSIGATDFSAFATGCITGNYTFPDLGGYTHKSIGLCNKCMETTSLIQSTIQTTAWRMPGFSYNISVYAMPNNQSIGAWSELPVFSPEILSVRKGELDWVLSAGPSDSFVTTLEASIYSFTVPNVTSEPCETSPTRATIAVHNCSHSGINLTVGGTTNLEQTFNSNVSFLAASCYLYPCLNTYFANESGGVLTEQVRRSVPLIGIPLPAQVDEEAVEGPPSFYRYAVFCSPCIVDGLQYDRTNLSTLSLSDHYWVNVTDEADGSLIAAPIDCVYLLDHFEVVALRTFCQAALNGSCFQTSEMDGLPRGSSCKPNWWIEGL
jgi:hypothetical protein